MFGDQGFFERGHNVSFSRSGEEDLVERLDGLVSLPQEWHKKKVWMFCFGSNTLFLRWVVFLLVTGGKLLWGGGETGDVVTRSNITDKYWLSSHNITTYTTTTKKFPPCDKKINTHTDQYSFSYRKTWWFITSSTTWATRLHNLVLSRTSRRGFTTTRFIIFTIVSSVALHYRPRKTYPTSMHAMTSWRSPPSVIL